MENKTRLQSTYCSIKKIWVYSIETFPTPSPILLCFYRFWTIRSPTLLFIHGFISQLPLVAANQLQLPAIHIARSHTLMVCRRLCTRWSAHYTHRDCIERLQTLNTSILTQPAPFYVLSLWTRKAYSMRYEHHHGYFYKTCRYGSNIHLKPPTTPFEWSYNTMFTNTTDQHRSIVLFIGYHADTFDNIGASSSFLNVTTDIQKMQAQCTTSWYIHHSTRYQ